MSILKPLALIALLSALATGAPLSAPALSAPLVATHVAAATPAAPDDTAEDAPLATDVLANLSATYRYLDDVSIVFGATPNDAEAVAYYTEGQIVINPAHEVGIERILEHEVWHLIDWRDNGRIDWGESLPPANAATYLQ